MFNVYQEAMESHTLIKKVNKKLRKEFNITAFLYRVCMKNLPKTKFPEEFKRFSSKGNVTAPYYVFYCSKKLSYNKVCGVINGELDEVFVTSSITKCSEGNIGKACASIKKERPHKVSKIVGENGSRYGVLNKKCLVPTN